MQVIYSNVLRVDTHDLPTIYNTYAKRNLIVNLQHTGDVWCGWAILYMIWIIGSREICILGTATATHTPAIHQCWS